MKNGADSIQVFSDLNLLRENAIKWDADKRLMLAERGGKKIDGFDLGNSPLAVTKEKVQGKRLFMSTTNGTKSLKKVQNVKYLFAMALPNRKVVAERIMSLNKKNVFILGSGWEGSYSLEDSLAAGALALYIKENYKYEVNIYNDEPVSVIMPDSCVEEIMEADAVIKGQTVSSSFKPAILKNGVKVMVPGHIEVGTRIVVRPSDNTYIEKAKS